MTRRVVVAVMVVSLALAALVGWSAHSIRQSRSELIEHFGDQSMHRLDEIATLVREDVQGVQRDLVFTTRLVETAPALDHTERELRALLTIVKQYRRADVFDAAGRQVETEIDDGAGRPFRTATFQRAIADSARRARVLPPGGLDVSPPVLGDHDDWYRVFTMPLRDGSGAHLGCLALLVDMQAIFARLQLLGSPTKRLLVLGSTGEPAPDTRPELARAIMAAPRDPRATPKLATMLTALRQGGRGSLRIDGDEAARLGLPPFPAIGAYEPIDGPAGRWAIASIGSTSTLQTHERALLTRVTVTSAMAALALVALGIFVVVSARQAQAMRERIRHAEALEQLSEQNRRILDNIPVGVVTLGRDGRIRSLNRTLRDRLPPAGELRTLGDAFPRLSPAARGMVQELVDEAQSSGRVRTLARQRVRLFDDEGEFRLHAVPLGDGDGQVATVLVIEDLTEIESLTRQLLRAEKLATVGILGAGIAHEIGTPLGVIRARAEFILGKLGREHSQASGLETIVRQSDHVTRVIAQLLDFSRTRPATVRRVDVEAVAGAVADLVRFQADKRGVEVVVEVAAGTPAVAADSDQLQQVLVNLVLNAIDASDRASRVAVQVRADGADGAGAAVRIDVVDRGCGIPEDHRHQVFDPFFTTKKRGQGTGLGLTVAAHIVRSHGGRIELESERARGTRVTLLWPRATVEPIQDDVAVAR